MADSPRRLRVDGRERAAGSADFAGVELGAGLGPRRAEPSAACGSGAARLPERGRRGDAEARTGPRAVPPPLRIRSLGRGKADEAGGVAASGAEERTLGAETGRGALGWGVAMAGDRTLGMGAES